VPRPIKKEKRYNIAKKNKKHLKSFGVFYFFKYNNYMKKILGVLLSILFTIPMLVGMCFLSPASQATLNGGGGGNPLNYPNYGKKKKRSFFFLKRFPKKKKEI